MEQNKSFHLITRNLTVLIGIGMIGAERVKDLVHKETILNLRRFKRHFARMRRREDD
jgi:hypothetical protein